MARTEARVFVSAWEKGSDFRDLKRRAQGTYFFLLSNPDLSHAGTLPLRLSRWSATAAEQTIEDLEQDLAELEASRFIVVDKVTEEVLVRSLIRRDKVAMNPGLFQAAVQQIALVESTRIRAVILGELRRLEASPQEVNGKVKPIMAAVIETLSREIDPPPDGPSAGPDGGPPEGPPLGPAEGGCVTSKGKGADVRTEVVPPTPFPRPPSNSSSATASRDAEAGQGREDVRRVCEHLADCIAGNGSKRPTITKRWEDAARLLMDKDGRTEEQVHRAIDWCQDDDFWRSNILSMPKLREKYDQLRLKAMNGRASPGAGPVRSTTDERVAQAQALKERFRTPPPVTIRGEITDGS